MTPQESSDLLRAMASSRSSCSCWVSLASRSFSSRSLSRFAHSIISSSVGYYSVNTDNTHTHTQREGKQTQMQRKETNMYVVKKFLKMKTCLEPVNNN